MAKKYITKITAKQQKFIDIYTSRYGELSATDCAIKRGMIGAAPILEQMNY